MASEELENLLAEAENVSIQCSNLSHIKGIKKLQRQVMSELKFLKQLSKKQVQQQLSQIKSSNLSSLKGILHQVQTQTDVTGVLKKWPDQEKLRDGLVVDVICDGGATWVKVIARNPQALHLVWAGRGQYGERSVVHQASQYLLSAKQHLHMFAPPKVVFVFVLGVTSELADTLRAKGVHICGETVDVAEDVRLRLSVLSSFSDSSDDDFSDVDYLTSACASKASRLSTLPSDHKSICSDLDVDFNKFSLRSVADPKLNRGEPDLDAPVRVNLDITCLINLVSELTHGGCHFRFKDPIIDEQAQKERECASLPHLEHFLRDKQLVVCRTAADDFNAILSQVAGGRERQRAAQLMQRVHVLPDQPSARTQSMADTAKLRPRSKIIFGTGDSLRLVTCSANVGFIRAARSQNVEYAVFTHQPRALTERKEAAATPIPSSHPSSSGMQLLQPELGL